MMIPKPLSPTMLAWLAAVLVPLQPMLRDGDCCCPDGHRAIAGVSAGEASCTERVRVFVEDRPAAQPPCCAAAGAQADSLVPVGGAPCDCEIRPAPPVDEPAPGVARVRADAPEHGPLLATAAEGAPETERGPLSAEAPHRPCRSSVAVCRLLCRYLL